MARVKKVAEEVKVVEPEQKVVVETPKEEVKGSYTVVVRKNNPYGPQIGFTRSFSVKADAEAFCKRFHADIV